ncbi:ATP-binding protein [Streptomyces sp. WMMB 322]|uniref:ATP-binding protein n=1 Tax=Streptomyces sp. WMMB 322 TaxID=1286821 RepID=UPI00082391AA|nr:Anti-sigma regulatory factor (Ser/Thr protein kinase) [Streptomyces sp. WMMB 322]
MPTYSRTFPGLMEQVGHARRWTRDILSDNAHADDAALIVTELGTNALLHSASGNEGAVFYLTITRTPETVWISVTDAGGTRTTPHVEHPDENETHGRGLALVSALTQRLHVHGNDEYGHTVTAELHAASANTGLLHGYWCECTVNGGKLGSFDATDPEQALRWVRTSLMMIATSLDEDAYRQAQNWTSDGQLPALRALHDGNSETVTIKHETTEITWTTRPVSFLPLANRQGAILPTCAEQHSTTQLDGLSRQASGETGL